MRAIQLMSMCSNSPCVMTAIYMLRVEIFIFDLVMRTTDQRKSLGSSVEIQWKIIFVWCNVGRLIW